MSMNVRMERNVFPLFLAMNANALMKATLENIAKTVIAFTPLYEIII